MRNYIFYKNFTSCEPGIGALAGVALSLQSHPQVRISRETAETLRAGASSGTRSGMGVNSTF